ncbi:MAG: hypothetical protein HDR80_03640 [Bacteroides sp.]|nr:hypothetical protein [Bacteroides sp.]
MKFLLPAALVAVLGLASCSADSKLANELEGTWKGSTVSMTPGKAPRPDDRHKGHDDMHRHPDGKPEFSAMSCTPTLTFVKTDGGVGGTIDITAEYTITQGVESVAKTTPVNATFSGTVNASGTWTVHDGDEVKLTMNPAKTVVNVDPTSLTLAYASITDAPQEFLDSLKVKVAANLETAVRPMLGARVERMHEFDDVKVTGNTMTLEAGPHKLSFTKQ